MRNLILLKERKGAKRKITIVSSILFAIALFQSAASAYDYVYIDDGANHVIGDDTFQNSYIVLDYHTANNPGTHFQIVDGGNVWQFSTYNNSTITVDGGSISNMIIGSSNSEIVVDGGTVGTIWADGHSSVTVNGGAINGFISAFGNGTAEVRGGTLLNAIQAWNSGKIYLYGNSFSVGGIELSYGDSLQDYGVIGGANNANLTGTITGTLLDGSLLNTEFFLPLNNPGGADIIVVPEPATITLLLTAGVLFLRRRRLPNSFLSGKSCISEF